MIEQIIEKFEKKLEDRVEKGGFTYLYEGRDELDREEIENFIRSEFSSYNKQLLDGVEGEAKSILTSEGTLYCRDGIEICTECENPRRIRQFLSTLNKYGV